jgi:hypothetical protein
VFVCVYDSAVPHTGPRPPSPRRMCSAGVTALACAAQGEWRRHQRFHASMCKSLMHMKNLRFRQLIQYRCTVKIRVKKLCVFCITPSVAESVYNTGLYRLITIIQGYNPDIAKLYSNPIFYIIAHSSKAAKPIKPAKPLQICRLFNNVVIVLTE